MVTNLRGIFMRKLELSFFKAVLVLCLAVGSYVQAQEQTADTNTTAGAAPVVLQKPDEPISSNEALRVSLQLQEQLHAAQLATERGRKEAEDAANIAARLQAIEQSIAAQHRGELEAAQSTTRFMLVVLTVFAIVGFVAVVLTAYFQWRTVNRLADISAALPGGRRMTDLNSAAALGIGESNLLAATPVEQSSLRLLGAIERLEKRINELEQTTTPALGERVATINGTASTNGETDVEPPAKPMVDQAQIKRFLEIGQTLLNQDRPAEALAAFDEALAMNPHNADVLVKRGSALEKLRRLQDAIDSYDRAIAADSSLTIAYLCKGGLFNRMERFSEAVECYEQALQTQEKKRAA
jgi:tetratricopeptide (TPR) repeat protein